MNIVNPKIPTHNRYSIFARCLNSDQDKEFHDTETKTLTQTPTLHKIQPNQPQTLLPPIYIYWNINHTKLLDALKEKYNNNFQVKFTSGRLKVMFTKQISWNLKICQKDNIEYHTFTVNSEKLLIVVLKGLIQLREGRIHENLKNQGL